MEDLTPTQYIAAAARAGVDLSGHDIPSFINSYAREKRNDQMIKGELEPRTWTSPAGDTYDIFGRQVFPSRATAAKGKTPLGTAVPLPGGQTGFFNGTTVVPLKQAPDLSEFSGMTDSRNQPYTVVKNGKRVWTAQAALNLGQKFGVIDGGLAPEPKGTGKGQGAGGLYERFLNWKSAKPGATNGTAAGPILSPTAGLDDEARPEDVWGAGN